MFGSIADGIRILGTGSLELTTGSVIADGGTNAVAYLMQGFFFAVNQLAAGIGS